jgi:hypothetical protein
VALLAEGGRGVDATLKDAEEVPAGGALSFCGRCESGKSGSGAFLLLRMRKNGLLDGLFLGVVAGLVCEIRSLELTSEREDSDWRLIRDGGAMPLKLGGVADDVRGDAGSSRGANEDRPFSSAVDFLGTSVGRVGAASPLSRGRSLERRNRAAARLIRELFFLTPPRSPVGAVVMISGAEPYCQQQARTW